MNTESELIPLEVVTPNVAEALERAAIDVQISTAHRFPRSLEGFKRRALEMATLDNETAESCIYARPVGKGPDGKQKYAEGASIRLAEIVAACYGNIRVASRIIEQTPRYVKVEGVAHDLESNYAGKSEVVEATVKSPKPGQAQGDPYDERMRSVVAKAALSKAYRDAVFKVVPKALCKTVIDSAKRLASGDGQSMDTRRGKAKNWVASLKGRDGKLIGEKRVFEALGVAGWAEVGEDQLITLTGLRTAIADNEVTPDEAFPVDRAETQAPSFDKKPKSMSKSAPAPDPVKDFFAWCDEKELHRPDVIRWLEATDESQVTPGLLASINRDELLADLSS